MFRKSFIILLFIPFLIMACATTQTPLQKKLLINSTPHFNGYISKIYKPFQPMYRPVESNCKLSISMEFPETTNSSTDKFTKYIEMTDSYKIEKLGDLLTWEHKYINITVDGKTVTLKGSPAFCRMLMDRFGNIQEVELMHPKFRVPNMYPTEQGEFISNLKSMHIIFYPPLPNNPVRSGDPIFKIFGITSFSEIDTELRKDFRIYKDLEYIIDGWSFFNEKKVVVASIDKVMDITEGNVEWQIKINGYTLYDAETFQIVDGHLSLVILPNPSSNIESPGTIRIHQSAELKK
jgi:hypothetical protein